MDSNSAGTNNFNYKITKFFLFNNRLTILCLILLLILGIFATVSLKTTGFPNPEIKFAQIQTIYPGASSETVVKEVTIPLENVIKDVSGVKTFTSSSNNSFSFIGVTIDDTADADNVRSKIDSAVKGVTLPAGAETPKIITPEINGPDFYFVITGRDYQSMYNLYARAKNDLLQFTETSSVDLVVDFGPKILVTLDNNKLRQQGITVDTVKSQLSSIGETLPVISDASIDSQSKTLVTRLNDPNFNNLGSLPIPTGGGTVNLGEIAKIELTYLFDNNDASNFAYNVNDAGIVEPAITFTVKSAKGSDLSQYTKKVYDKFDTYKDSNTDFIKAGEQITQENKNRIVETFAQNNSNQEQVGEVERGLVGGFLKDVDGPIKYLGLILGAVQLIFLVMIAFVSWRAAVVAALSIPLSLIFANIFLFFTGHELNTLVLFSLVLVLGLVVDPTLVVLEALQRKIDAGFKGRAASLEAIKDVGNGLFLAILANIIVFIPFGVISGILGQIFSYIPLTIIPALIGSYLIPLIFLAWIGGLILKPSKKSTNNEEANLWRVSRWLINTNNKILHSSIFLRIGIIALAVIIPFSIAGFFLGTGKIKSVQFASSDDSESMLLSGSYLTTISKEERDLISKDILRIVTDTKGVKNIFETSDGFNYFIDLQSKKDRNGLKAAEIADMVNSKINTKYPDKFFDVKADIIQTGPPEASYQVSIGVKTNDLNVLESSSKDVSKTLNNICSKNNIVTIDEECKDGERIVTKVDDGFTDKENKVIEIVLNRTKLLNQQLTIPNIPLTAIVNTQIKSLFSLQSDSENLGKLNANGEEVPIMLDKVSADPNNIAQIRDIVVYSPTSGKPIKLSDIADINETNSKSSITRVKGQTVNNVQARLKDNFNDQGTASLVTQAIEKYYNDNNGEKSKTLGLQQDSIEQYSEGDSASFIKSFQELSSALLLAIVLIYFVLTLFFKSFTLPLVILFTIPLTFIGVFPALAAFTGGQFGFLEIIGLIILTGLVVNVAIFLIDAAKQKVDHEGWDYKRAISYASGVRLRPVLLTKFTAIASLAPLALFSEFYRSIAIVIIFGLLTSGFTSLFTTPILYIFFKWLSGEFHALKWWGKILFFPLFPIYMIVMGLKNTKVN